MNNPLLETEPISTKLTASPLERVLAAVTFSPVLLIGKPHGAGIVGFQEKVRSNYPHLEFEHETTFRIEVGAGGELQEPSISSEPVWRFVSADRDWRVSLTTRSISIDTQRGYTSGKDLVDRITWLATIVAQEFEPTLITRIGFRFLNVFGPAKFAGLKNYVQPELQAFGVAPFVESLEHSSNSAQFRTPEGVLLLKHGVLASGMSHELLLAPVTERRWFLDIDCFSAQPENFSADKVGKVALALTKRCCSVFKWSVTPTFMEAYGAES